MDVDEEMLLPDAEIDGYCTTLDGVETGDGWYPVELASEESEADGENVNAFCGWGLDYTRRDN